MARFRLHLLEVRDAFDETFCQGHDSLLAPFSEHSYELRACVDAVPGEHLAFRDAQPRPVDEFQQNTCARLLQGGVLDFREFLFGKVFLPEYVHQALGALGHGDALGRILFENLAAYHVLPEALECRKVFADARRGEFLLHLEVPDERLDACLGKARQRSIGAGACEELVQRLAVGVDRPGRVPALRGEVCQELLDIIGK